MAETDESGGKFVYYNPFPRVGRNLELAFAFIFLAMFIGIPISQKGLLGAIQSIRDNPGLWVIFACIFVPGIAIFLRLAFPPRSWSARLEFEKGRFRLVPQPVLRWIGEPNVEVSLAAGAQEILICRGSEGQIPYGFRVVLCSAGSSEHAVKFTNGERLNLKQAKTLMEGITAATGLPVRLVQRKRLPEGTIEEIPWDLSAQKRDLFATATVILMFLPFVGGIIAGNLTTNPAIMGLVGLILWLVQLLAIFAIGRIHSDHKKPSPIYLLSTIFTFGASYAATVAIVIYVFRGQ